MAYPTLTQCPSVTKHRIVKLIAVLAIMTLLAAPVLAVCTFTVLVQGSTTDANLCSSSNDTFYVIAADTIRWSDQSKDSLVEAKYNAFRCGTDTAVITRSDGTFIESDSEPWIDYSYYKVELAYRSSNVPNAKFVVDEQYSLSCSRSHPSPVVINFDKSALQFTSPESGVEFDLSSIGIKQRLGWTQANSNVAFLIRGASVSDGRQLFGNLNDQAPPLTPDESENGYRALRVFDLNSDRQINAADPIWAELNLWFDRNHNGISEPEEVESLASRGILSISLDYNEIGKKDQFGNQHRQRARVSLVDGSERWSTDVYPAQSTDPVSSTVEVIEPNR